MLATAELCRLRCCWRIGSSLYDGERLHLPARKTWPIGTDEWSIDPTDTDCWAGRARSKPPVHQGDQSPPQTAAKTATPSMSERGRLEGDATTSTSERLADGAQRNGLQLGRNNGSWLGIGQRHGQVGQRLSNKALRTNGHGVGRSKGACWRSIWLMDGYSICQASEPE